MGLIGLAALALLGGIGYAALRALRQNRCVLALRGTNATLTVEGWGAQEECGRILAELGTPVSQWPGLVRVPKPYISEVLCQQSTGLTSYTVNGQPAAFGGIGWQLCFDHSPSDVYPGDLPPDKDAIDFYPR